MANVVRRVGDLEVTITQLNRRFDIRSLTHEKVEAEYEMAWSRVGRDVCYIEEGDDRSLMAFLRLQLTAEAPSVAVHWIVPSRGSAYRIRREADIKVTEVEREEEGEDDV